MLVVKVLANGTCNSDGSCACYENETQGYWKGDSCDECKENYYPRVCTNFCDASTTCSGNGIVYDGSYCNTGC